MNFLHMKKNCIVSPSAYLRLQFQNHFIAVHHFQGIEALVEASDCFGTKYYIDLILCRLIYCESQALLAQLAAIFHLEPTAVVQLGFRGQGQSRKLGDILPHPFYAIKLISISITW